MPALSSHSNSRCWLVVVVVLVVMVQQQKGVTGEVKLVDHGYEGIVIAINTFLKQEDTMLKRLEKYLTETSRTLFRATRNQLYFREFIVVIPETWKGLQHYENALDVQLDRAQIIIDHANLAYADAPYVKQYAECGQPGLYIHLTPSYLMDDDVIHKWGKPEKTLVHEWAHLRWGLFDEYPIDAQDAEFYRFNGVWQPTRCTTDVDGSILNEYTSSSCSFDFFTGKPEEACRFFPRMRSNKASASLMFMQYLDSIVEFCDDPVSSPKPLRHNYLAPNRQNRLCAYRSAWEVMRKHEDFRKARRPLPDDTDTTPVFRYVQVKPPKRALVLDTSGSMTGSSLSVMMRAASNYILSCVEEGSSLGIVQFSTNATALSPMITVTSDSDRRRLIKALPRQADGKTSIGAGLEKGLQLLRSVEGQPGGTIILITDGKENERPFLTDFQLKLQKLGVVVHALAYGQGAEKSIAQLSRTTGGKTFYYSGRKDSTALIDGLAATVLTHSPGLHSTLPVSLVTEAGTVTNGSALSGTFLIDPTVGSHTTFTVSYSHPVNVILTSPSDVTMTRASHEEQFLVDEESGVIKILLPGVAEVGRWKYLMETSSTKSDVVVNLQSTARSSGLEVIRVRSWIPDNTTIAFDPKQKVSIFAELIRGRSPVLGAEVVAVIERPKAAVLKVALYDNGVGSDVIKDDGVYAAYILSTYLSSNGRYNIKVQARGLEGGTKVVVGGGGRSSGALDTTAFAGRMEVLTESLALFQRVTSAGEFRVTGHPGKKAVVPDLMAPARITDLHLASFHPDTGEANLKWTAVGDDMDRGTASVYVMQISRDFDQLFTMEVNQTTWTTPALEQLLADLIPRPAGHPEQLTLSLQQLPENVTWFLSLRAVDDSGNSGELSNIVTLSRARELAVPIEMVPVTHSTQFYLKIILPPVATLLLFLVLAVVVLRSRRHKSMDAVLDEKDSGLTTSAFSLDLAHMAHMNYRHEGQYRPRCQEDPETWSELGKSRESLDIL
ncbi:calcium-activated chloride channel regulator 1-like [Babylonia areolata]|uniref:calcium-activated chloride channel regulator 1-like n=1 Tax=Babylonia areolata TaxID=304850 RepID=UPI003FD25413